MTGWQNENDGWGERSGHPGPTAEQGGFGGPERPSRLPAVLSMIAIVVIVGTVITIVLLNRGDGPTPVATPTSPPSRPPSSGPPTSKPTDDGTIDNPTARLSYRVPPDWKPAPTTVDVSGVEFTGTAVYGPYDCGGEPHTRAFAVSAAVQNRTDKDITPEKTAATFTRSFSEKSYPNSTVAEPTTRATEIDGKRAVTTVAKITPKPDQECEPTAAQISITAVDLDDATADKPRGIALLVVTSDVSGGPATPAPLPEQTIQAILTSTKVR